MKKTSGRKESQVPAEEMCREYCFDYANAKPNRFSALMKTGTIAVVLYPDVAAIFQSSESVNALLRSVISALPGRSTP